MTEKRQVVIVGASAGGLRCAARLKRLEPDWSVVVVEQSEVFSYAACGLPYVLSGDIASGPGPRGLQHSVIYSNGTLVHDPHPSGEGLKEIRSLILLTRGTAPTPPGERAGRKENNDTRRNG